MDPLDEAKDDLTVHVDYDGIIEGIAFGNL